MAQKVRIGTSQDFLRYKLGMQSQKIFGMYPFRNLQGIIMQIDRNKSQLAVNAVFHAIDVCRDKNTSQ